MTDMSTHTDTAQNTYDDLVARHAAGELSYYELIRGCRDAGEAVFALYEIDREARKADERATIARQRAESAARAAHGMTDEGLREKIERGTELGLPGLVAEGEILLTVAPEHRSAVVQAAMTFRNMTPDAGRWSDALRSCARDFPRAES